MKTLFIAIVFIVIVLAAFLMPRVMNYLQDKGLSKKGIAAPAEILSVEDTGNRVNYNPELKMKLRVSPENLPPYEAEVVQVISTAYVSLFQPSAKITVKYDPEDPTRVIVMESGTIK
ncbi:MAG: hypothetical protein A2122_00920 [Candidatus Liptonbacteria bacterium GWB1_49_6]|uniref:DUF3592 domain-containing protein n=1 Tax=Candidatus Liptonbacteria bacterium GWB1_49_6 TaxID=1798644 RepID=A0A1G2C7E4_9BACT|nr:MAG: hypothetical protein A2122_00920 [Candidatus Liptonbacteria bacterium GWB1_49_6]